jgi:phosphoribosylglycinamide formyltransferase 1
MAKMIIGILASGSGSNFAAIAKAIQAPNFTADLQISVLIYNNPQAYAAQRARELGIPAILLDHRKYLNREALDRAISQVLQSYNVDLVVMAGWMRVVTQELIDAFPERILNIHPSLLPSFPGIRAIEQALSYGVKITGCTVHIVSLVVDSGKILQQASVDISPSDTLDSLLAKIQVEEHLIYPQAIANYSNTLPKT